MDERNEGLRQDPGVLRDFIFPPRLKQIDQNDLGSVISSTLVYFTPLPS